MAFVILGLQVILGIASLACFIMVIMKMFEHGDKGIAITSLVLILCCIGGLVAFIMGWVNVTKYNIKNLMLAWTGIIVINLIVSVVGQVIVGSQATTTFQKTGSTFTFPTQPQRR